MHENEQQKYLHHQTMKDLKANFYKINFEKALSISAYTCSKSHLEQRSNPSDTSALCMFAFGCGLVSSLARQQSLYVGLETVELFWQAWQLT